jgi:hypothetical protein
MTKVLDVRVGGHIDINSLFTTVITSRFLWIRTNICRLLESLLLPVTEKTKPWKGSTTRVIQSVSEIHIITVVKACSTLFVAGQLWQNLISMQATWNSIHKVKNELVYRYFTLYSSCIMITNQKFKNQHMHCILTPTYVSASTSHLQGGQSSTYF